VQTEEPGLDDERRATGIRSPEAELRAADAEREDRRLAGDERAALEGDEAADGWRGRNTI
jgi:hypothetical protein